MQDKKQLIDFETNKVTTGTHLSLKDKECMTVVRILNSNYVGQVIVVVESGDIDEIYTTRMSIEEAENTFNIEIIK